jgi:hypothetical protein
MAFAAVMVLSASSVFAAGTTIYDNIPNPLPGNVPSYAYEANGVRQFGDQVAFSGSERKLRDITVLMSSWGCQSGHWYSNDCVTTPGATFSHPITVNVYAVGPAGSVGALLATKTTTFAIPYRPSADPDCPAGTWEHSPGNCFNGLANTITFDLSSLNVTLPNNAIVSVAYNTTHYGYAPVGESAACYTSSGGCGYDSLNVGLVDPALTQTSGTNPAPTDAYQDNVFGFNYCDGGVGGTSTFRLDAGCWAGFKPALRVTASFATATTGNACKKDGWMALSRADGSNFKNQGDCMQYVNTGK